MAERDEIVVISENGNDPAPERVAVLAALAAAGRKLEHDFERRAVIEAFLICFTNFATACYGVDAARAYLELAIEQLPRIASARTAFRSRPEGHA
jgi:hypothetical protein